MINGDAKQGPQSAGEKTDPGPAEQENSRAWLLFFDLSDILGSGRGETALQEALALCASSLEASKVALFTRTGDARLLRLCAWDGRQLTLAEEPLPDQPFSGNEKPGGEESGEESSRQASFREAFRNLQGARVSDDSLLQTALFSGCASADAEPGTQLVTVENALPNGYQGFLVLVGTDFGGLDKEMGQVQSIAQLLFASAFDHLRTRALQGRIESLNAILNFSDSIYSSWHQREGWHYHNVNGIVELGYDKESVSLRPEQSQNPMHPDDWKLGARLFEKTLATGRGYQHDYRAVGRNGEIRWYGSQVTVTGHNANGSARELVSISRDITAIRTAVRKAVEKANLEKWLVAKVNSIFSCNDFESMNAVLREIGSYLGVDRCSIRVVDPETLYCNLVGEWHRPSLKPLAQLYPEMTSHTGVGWIGQLIALGNAYAVNDVAGEVQHEKLRSYYRAIGVQSCITQPMILEDRLIGYLNLMFQTPHTWTEMELRVAREITDAVHMTIVRMRLLDELRANDERFQLAMASSTYGVWDQDCVAQTMYYSPHFYERLGHPRHDRAIPLEKILSYIHPEDHHLLFRQQKLEMETDIIDLELRHLRKDGSYIWMMSRGKVVQRDEHGKPLRLVGVNIDISEQKAMLAELHEARQAAEEANRSKSEFLERMSHEIRTPMNAVMGMSYLALDTTMDGEQLGFMEDIDAAAKSLLHIIDDILDFSKIEAGELSIVNERFDLREELERIIKLMSVRARQEDNDLSLELADDLPSFVVGDKHRLGQVLTNLLSNALKFTSQGRVRLEVSTASAIPGSDSQHLLFSVQDSGIGLNREQIAAVFEPFVQAEDSTSRKYGGTGLGLTICKHLVEMMGGSIQCRSAPGVGTTFEFTVAFAKPLDSPGERQAAVLPPRRAVLPDSQNLDGTRVLLVDDNLVNQRVAIGILNKVGVETVTAANGAEALRMLGAAGAKPFDAVLMDLEMPVLDGIEATRRIRQQTRFGTLPIIAVTAHAMTGDRERCIAAGMNEHVPKPIDPEKLIRVLSRTLAAAKAHSP